MKMEEESKIKFTNEWSEENFIGWIDDCPFCHAATLAGYEEYVKGNDDNIIFAVWFCADCDKVFNWDETSPEVVIRWINKEDATAKGWTIETVNEVEASKPARETNKELLN